MPKGYGEARIKRLKSIIELLKQEELTSKDIMERFQIESFTAYKDLEIIKEYFGIKSRNENARCGSQKYYSMDKDTIVDFEVLKEKEVKYTKEYEIDRLPRLKDIDRYVLREIMALVIIQAIEDYRKPKLVNGTSSKDKTRQLQNIKNRASGWLQSEQCLEYCEELEYDRNLILRNLGIKGSVAL